MEREVCKDKFARARNSRRVECLYQGGKKCLILEQVEGSRYVSMATLSEHKNQDEGHILKAGRGKVTNL